MQLPRPLTIILLVGLLAVNGRAMVQANGSRDTPFNDPFAGSGQGHATFATGINAQGDVVGFYIDSKSVGRGFLLHRGQYTSLHDPRAGGGQGKFTFALGINTQRDIVGTYVNSKGCYLRVPAAPRSLHVPQRSARVWVHWRSWHQRARGYRGLLPRQPWCHPRVSDAPGPLQRFQ